ncbi:sulfite exporter TauE/SafE family protein [Nonomuraea cavernae]|uniref:Probable membrane transporter protein n=1 Tax=Nonomuraea cavernae TaxID=2045107 RepID=A0A917YTV2_9ACTN|nr:sulfite exporter TauE/SafE family protein [Nonomuraea cavernae]GGO65866.1 hypothetical protein GCM10012289_18580 [Nonomuraea cavernae]
MTALILIGAVTVGLTLGLFGGGGSILTVPLLVYLAGVGAGGGFLVVPALVLLGGMPMSMAVATSLVVIAMKSFAGLAGYLQTIPVDWSIALPATAAAVGGSPGASPPTASARDSAGSSS